MGFPQNQGLYDSRNEHDACGVGFVANIRGARSHDTVKRGLQILINLAPAELLKEGTWLGIVRDPREFVGRPSCGTVRSPWKQNRMKKKRGGEYR